MEVDIKKNIYLYGKCSGKYDSEEDKENNFKIYTARNLSVFENVPLSSLEGYFISDESNIKRENRLSWFPPQMVFRKDKMREFEKKYNGKFFPFEK